MDILSKPAILPVRLSDLRPTQMTVGLHSVEEKRKFWRDLGSLGGSEHLKMRPIPVIIGPMRELYLIDRHHFTRALAEENVGNAYASVLADLSALEPGAFWFFMECQNWVRPFDSNGHRCSYRDMPKSVRGLADDPFRSLATVLRHKGIYDKTDQPFSEFLWADFLRRHIKRKWVEGDFNRAIAKATKLAKSRKADYLPGWRGAVIH